MKSGPLSYLTRKSPHYLNGRHVLLCTLYACQFSKILTLGGRQLISVRLCIAVQ